MSRWLLCLFAYNRLPLLRNAVNSIERFLPNVDRMIIDDGSTEEGTPEFLESLRAKGWNVVIQKRIDGRNYGGYYHNQRLALDTALAKGYDRLFFFEDDEQFVWEMPDYTRWVDEFFRSCPDAIQIQPLFCRRIIDYSAACEYVASVRAYRTNRGFSTTAVWNLDIVRKHPDYRFIAEYGDGLAINSAYWLRKGYRLYFQAEPTVAILPWVPSRSVDGIEKMKHMVAPDSADGLILKPLDADAIGYLRTSTGEIAPYQEYFRLSAENCERPIWHQQGLKMDRYLELCTQIVRSEDAAGASPKRIRRVDSHFAATLPPLQSHLDWEGRVKASAQQATPRIPWPNALRIAARRFRAWKIETLSDKRGYDELCRRLVAEQSKLSHWKTVASDPG